MAMLMMVVALAGVAWWLWASPVRAVVPAGVLMATHPVATAALIAAVAVVIVAIATVIVWRSLADSGWRLMIVTRTSAGVA